jgi:HlyD family secretion protein
VTNADPSALDALLGAAPQGRRRHSLSLLLLALVIVGVAVLLARFVYGTTSPYYTVPVERDSITPVLSLRGVLQGDGEVTLVAAQDGTVVGVPDPGAARVRPGEDLVTMDTTAMTRALDNDVAAQSLAEATLAHAQGVLNEAQVRFGRYNGVWRRSAGRVPSLNEMENARADVARAELGLVQAQTRREAATRQVAHDRAALANAVARAPLAGFLVACRVTPGQVVRAGQPLCTLTTHPERLTIATPVSAADAARLNPGAMARVLIDGLADQEYSARLLRITAAQGGSDRAKVAVLALVPPIGATHARAPYPGLGATVQIALPERKGVLLVPNAALAFSLDRNPRAEPPGVYVAHDDDSPRRVAVAVGASDGRRSEVMSSALQPGSQVIIGWRAGDKH